MVLTYICWGYAHDEAIIKTFCEMGMEVCTVTIGEEEWQEKERWQEKLSAVMGDIVFSVNFHGEISDYCQECAVPYATWVLQLPNYDLYTQSVHNPCNYIAVCDSYLVEKLLGAGVRKVFFLPDAVEEGTTEITQPLQRGIYFMDNYPQDVLNRESLSLYCIGYLDAFVHAQRILYNDYILEKGLSNRVLKEAAAGNGIPQVILPEFQRLFFADYYTAPICTAARQKIFLQNHDNLMTICSDSDFPGCKCNKFPLPVQQEEREQIYREKEFIVVLAPLHLHNAIPRAMLEVVAAGGFPLCSMQKDYSYLFENEKNMAGFCTKAEFNDLLVRYGNNYEERKRLQEAMQETVAKYHTYRSRIELMLQMWEQLS